MYAFDIKTFPGLALAAKIKQNTVTIRYMSVVFPTYLKIKAYSLKCFA
jgi:hypothetical protein